MMNFLTLKASLLHILISHRPKYSLQDPDDDDDDSTINNNNNNNNELLLLLLSLLLLFYTDGDLRVVYGYSYAL